MSKIFVVFLILEDLLKTGFGVTAGDSITGESWIPSTSLSGGTCGVDDVEGMDSFNGKNIRFCFPKMSTSEPNMVFFREVLLRYFNMKKKAAKSHRNLVEVYGDHALAEQTCQKWFSQFKSGNFDLEDKESPRAPPKFEDKRLEARRHER
ncbi:EHMT1 [Cordylochernes scorpioides]|uniref:EHMT1 n=1 Tax=Cordylochernes scorpioides TaxID=51811 RepID=A0ABY6LNF7_9ARAC|nr:EHMT1 [Cordylochernes scorpioides]